MKKLFSFLVSFVALAVAVPLFADDLSDAQRRIQARQVDLAALKEKGVLGENNRGFVEVREAAPGAEAVVSAENADRGTIYGILAKQTSSTAEAVGRARARQIAANSRAGVWVQDEAGRWSRK